MQSLVRSRLEAARKELLELGLRNPLISYRPGLSRGVVVTGENAASVFDQLVVQGRALTFAPETSGTDSGGALSTSDTRLQTSETAVRLQQRLLNTYYTARTTIEEQGVNTLYLALGMLHWYESDGSSEVRQAPLLLVPVTLERQNAREKFKLTYSSEDIGPNLSLEAKLRAEFGISLPSFDTEEELNPNAYFDGIAAAVSSLSRWLVDANSIVLGFFSFGKFLLFNDLDETSWPADAIPAGHPLLHQLLGGGFSEPAPSVGEEAFLDDEPLSGELLQAVDADATQVLAMMAVHEGRNLVIQGPPGTGKSQTITNIIANAIGQGKKVLFVAEKNAALEVVKRRLDALQLGEACLELHSHKANKKELHAELRRTLELGKPALQHLQQQVALLAQHREELNSYSKAVNAEIQRSGLSAHDVAGRLLQLAAETGNASLPPLHFADIQSWDAMRMQRAEAFAERVAGTLQPGHTPAQYLFWGSGLQALLPNQQPRLAALVQDAVTATTQLTGFVTDVAQQTGMPVAANREQCMQLAAMLEMAAARPAMPGTSVRVQGWAGQQAALAELTGAGQRWKALRSQYNSLLIPEAWTTNVLPIRAALLSYGSKWYRFFIGAYRAAIRQLAGLSAGPLPKGHAERLALAEAILESQRLEQQIGEGKELALHFFGPAWQGTGSDWVQLEAVSSYMAGVETALSGGRFDPALRAFLERDDVAAVAGSLHPQLLKRLNEQGLLVQELGTALAFNDSARFAGSTLLHQHFVVQLPLLQAWYERMHELQWVIAFNNLVDIAARESLLPLMQLAAQWPEACRYLKQAVQKAWYDHLLHTALTSFAPLRQFERSAHETVINQFRQLDLRWLQYNRARAALKHWEGLPHSDAGGQMTILRTEFNRKARHLPIRRLMEEAGLAIQAIKPVFMMSPLSIANFIPPGTLQFDLVIFDEASQVRPVEALGALLRGRQLVVVGDSKQMPPTSFFDSLGTDEGDAESITGDLPSILSLCDAQGAPQRMLRWHYRSRHESLIRLSNHEFYDNRLVVFPSPGLRQGAGLFFHHLPNTAYDRGQTRTNPEEAAEVARRVLDHARRHKGQTLGVVAFSTAQRDAIQDRIEMLRREHPEVEAFVQQHPNEPFFVKNLENVQGDERDVIFISIGYGRTREGFVSQSFGPVNNDGGEKRLNVLITRARLRCEVFTNLTADDIDTSKTSSMGVKVLKSFLRFAQKGIVDVPQVSGREAGSPFEEAVADRLGRMGYQVHRQVGSSGFFIDLAIVDPEHPGRYVLGIECDGAAYHSARSARDRDRLRQQVLEAMGWTIHRIWSTDWFRNPEQELERLAIAVNTAWKAGLDASDEDESAVADTAIIREAPKPGMARLQAYQMVQLPSEISNAEMHQHPVGKVAKWIELVVRVEGPIHFDELARRMVEAAGITRVGPRIREHLKLATRFAEGSGAVRQTGSFLYLNGNAQPALRDRSALPAASRKWKYVAPEEIAGVLYKVVREAVAIEPDEAYPLVVRLLGFARVTEEMRNDILELVPAMEASGLLVNEQGMLRALA